MQAKLKLMHECFESCWKCNGSGEGMYDGSRGCTECRGRGNIWNRGEPVDEMEVEWNLPDFSDLEITDGYDECDYCGQDMVECAREELKWRMDNGQHT